MTLRLRFWLLDCCAWLPSLRAQPWNQDERACLSPAAAERHGSAAPAAPSCPPRGYRSTVQPWLDLGASPGEPCSTAKTTRPGELPPAWIPGPWMLPPLCLNDSFTAERLRKNRRKKQKLYVNCGHVPCSSWGAVHPVKKAGVLCPAFPYL